MNLRVATQIYQDSKTNMALKNPALSGMIMGSAEFRRFHLNHQGKVKTVQELVERQAREVEHLETMKRGWQSSLNQKVVLKGDKAHIAFVDKLSRLDEEIKLRKQQLEITTEFRRQYPKITDVDEMIAKKAFDAPDLSTVVSELDSEIKDIELSMKKLKATGLDERDLTRLEWQHRDLTKVQTALKEYAKANGDQGNSAEILKYLSERKKEGWPGDWKPNEKSMDSLRVYLRQKVFYATEWGKAAANYTRWTGQTLRKTTGATSKVLGATGKLGVKGALALGGLAIEGLFELGFKTADGLQAANGTDINVSLYSDNPDKLFENMQQNARTDHFFKQVCTWASESDEFSKVLSEHLNTISEYAAINGLPYVASLDATLNSKGYFQTELPQGQRPQKNPKGAK